MSKLYDFLRIKYLKKYNDFDDFIKINDIEVLTFSDGVAARYKTFKTLKNRKRQAWVQETTVNQVIGTDYADLTNKIKKKWRFLSRFPIFYILLFIAFIFMSYVMADIDPLFLVLTIPMTLFVLYYVIFGLIRYINKKRLFRTNSVITEDYIKYYFNFAGSLFSDVLRPKQSKENNK